jgi:hypothetical protein
MKALGLHMGMTTNTGTIKDILEEMKLDDFKTEYEPMKRFFSKIASNPQDLDPMFSNIQQGIIDKHPAVIEFAEKALDENWFSPSKHIQRAVNVAFILEALTSAMCNSHKFFVEVQDHYKAKEKTVGLDTRYAFKTFAHALRIDPDFFNIAKAFSLDPLMIYFRIQRGLNKSQLTKSELKKLYKNKEINYIEYKLLSPTRKGSLEHINELIRINIYEAGTTEYKNEFKANAICAYALSENIKTNPPHTTFKKKNVVPENNTDIFYKSIVEKENFFPVIEFNQDWNSLYLTWNMAFVLGNLDDLDMIFPKLLIPTVINAESENFLNARIIALWLSINHIIFRKYHKKELVGPKNKKEMAKAWGEINKKYAFALAEEEIHENSKTLKKNFKKRFAQPICNLIKLAIRFLV